MTFLFPILTLVFLSLWIWSRRDLKNLQGKFNSYAKEQEDGFRRLRDSKNRYKLIVEHMNEAIAAVDEQVRIKYCNQPFMNMFGSGHIIEENTVFADVVRHTQLNELLHTSLSSKKAQRKVMEFSVNGQIRTSEVQSVFIPMQDTDFVALVFYDLTEIKESEKMKRDFITNASHQLKTPLTAIQGYAETLIEDAEMEIKVRNDFLRKIEVKSIEAADLVSKLLKLSKLESNVEAIQPVNISVEKTLQDMERKFEGILKKYQIQFVHQLDSDSIQIHTDIALFQLILENLLENAVKYSKPHGKVFLSAKQHDANIQLDIRDEGIGIPEQDQSRIFERFFRSHNAENHTQNGTGIGMALVKSALEKIHGSLEIKSSQNAGTTMHLTFPRELS